MSTAIKSLAILLIAQVILTAGVTFRDNQLATFIPNEKFLSLSLTDLTKIVLSDGEKSLAIEKIDGMWALPEAHNFPISSSKETTFSEKLFTLEKPFPVANTAIAAKQLEVSADKFKKKVEFYRDDKLTETLYLGTSPGFKKVHARRESEDQSYAVAFSAYDLQMTASSWYERDFLKISRGDIKKITYDDLNIVLEDNSPTLEGLTETEELVTAEVDNFIKATTRPSYNDLLGTEVKDEFNLDQPVLTYTIEKSDGEAVTYTYSKAISKPEKDLEEGSTDKDKKAEEYYVLKLSTAPFFFRVAQSTVDGVKKFGRSTLVKAKEIEVTPESESEEETAQETEVMKK